MVESKENKTEEEIRKAELKKGYSHDLHVALRDARSGLANSDKQKVWESKISAFYDTCIKPVRKDVDGRLAPKRKEKQEEDVAIDDSYEARLKDVMKDHHIKGFDEITGKLVFKKGVGTGKKNKQLAKKKYNQLVRETRERKKENARAFYRFYFRTLIDVCEDHNLLRKIKWEETGGGFNGS